jgi:F-type H+-transporting ATPase subunit epsilon
MAEYIQLDIVTPEKSLFSRKVLEVIAPGEAGEFGVLPGHTPFLTTLRPGQVTATTEDESTFFAISGGFAEVTGSRVIILAEEAERAEDIKVEEVNKNLEVAKNKLDGLDKEDPEYSKILKRIRGLEVMLRVSEAVKE